LENGSPASQNMPPRPTALPQEKAEPEGKSPSFAATEEEPKKECTPRLDWAGLLRRTFALPGRQLTLGWRSMTRSDTVSPATAP
jgi:hypothetical protein